jgi:hypothetical protein
VIAHSFAVALWMFGLFRTGLRFFYVLIFAALLGLVLALINVVVYYDPHFMPQLLGARGFALFFDCYIWLLLLQFIVSLFGATIMVRWICSVRGDRTNPKV